MKKKITEKNKNKILIIYCIKAFINLCFLIKEIKSRNESLRLIQQSNDLKNHVSLLLLAFNNESDNNKLIILQYLSFYWNLRGINFLQNGIRDDESN